MGSTTLGYVPSMVAAVELLSPSLCIPDCLALVLTSQIAPSQSNLGVAWTCVQPHIHLRQQQLWLQLRLLRLPSAVSEPPTPASVQWDTPLHPSLFVPQPPTLWAGDPNGLQYTQQHRQHSSNRRDTQNCYEKTLL